MPLVADYKTLCNLYSSIGPLEAKLLTGVTELKYSFQEAFHGIHGRFLAPLKHHLKFKVSKVQRSGIDTIKPRIQMEKVAFSQLGTPNESQEVSPFPVGDHKAHINRRAQRHNKRKTEKNHERSTKEILPWNDQ